MAHSAEAIANYFLDLAKETGCHDLSPMKIQKLVYFAHGWHLALTGKPLFGEAVQAWRYGPVIQSLYREFKGFGGRCIDRPARNIRWVEDKSLWASRGQMEVYEPFLNGDDDGSVRELLDRVWEVYRRYTPIQLSNMTHQKGSPWDQVASQFMGGRLPRGIDIPNEVIRDHFREKARSRGGVAHAG